MPQTKIKISQIDTLGSGNIATDMEVTELLDSHVSLPNPHPQYIVQDPNNMIVFTINAAAIMDIIQNINLDGGVY